MRTRLALALLITFASVVAADLVGVGGGNTSQGNDPPPATPPLEPPPNGDLGFIEIVPSSEPFAPLALARDLPHSPWFALTSGLASICGFLIALYATQVRTIPFSLYRSLMWRKALLLSTAVGLFVYGGVEFYRQAQAPHDSPLREFHAMLLGVLRVSPVDYEPHGPALWALICLSGVVLLVVGVVYDPPARARRLLIREQQALHQALSEHLSRLLHGQSADKLESPDDRILDDTIEYFRHVQWRFSDVVLGPPPPTFPLSYKHRATLDREE